MQVMLCRDDEHMIGLDDQSFRDQFNRHRSVLWENLVKQGGHGSQVIDDHARDAHIGRQVA
jgi:hypothetical protein